MESRKYAVDALFYFPLIEDGDADFVTDYTPAAGDAKIFTDKLISTNPTALILGFDSLSELPAQGAQLDENGAGTAEGVVAFTVIVSGTVGGGDAAGFFFMRSVTGQAWTNNDQIDINGGTANIATADSTTYDLAATAGLIAEIGNGMFAAALSVSEMTCAQGQIHIVDSATKAIEDQAIQFHTYGNALALHAFDLDTATQDVNTIQISGDSTAADNLELMYDGTGYTDQTAPSSRSQVDAIGAASGGAFPIEVSEDNTSGAIDPGSTTKVWATVAGTFANIDADNGLSHDFTDTGNDISHVYGFQVGGGRTATSVSFIGNVDGNNDQIQIEVWDHPGAKWDVIGTILGSGGTINRTLDRPLLLRHTGTSASEIGKVYIQMDTNSTTPSDLSVELLLVFAVNIGQTGGYALGRIWLNTGASNTNTEIHVDGVSTNPVSTITAAKTLSNNSELNLSDFQIINGSSITLAESTANESYFGDNWTLALGNQACGGAHFDGATVSGVATGTGTGFHGGEIGTVTLGDDAHIDEAGLSGTITLPAGSINLFHCHHDGASAPVLDFGAAVGSTTVHMHHYSGAIELQNFGDSGTDIVHLDGSGKLIINANSSGGTINLRGNWEIQDDDGNATINYDDQSQGYDGGRVWIDTNGGTAGTNDHINGTSDTPCLTLADAKTLSTSTGLSDFQIINGSSIALAESTDNESYFGDNWSLDLSDESVDGAHFVGATVSGAGPSAAAVHYEGCNFTTASLALAHCDFCAFAGTVTQTTAGDYEYHNCYSKGTTAPIFTKTAGQAINAEFHNYSGDITISGLQSGDVIELGGNFRTVILNGADATVHIHGHYETLTNNLTGSPTVQISGATKFGDMADVKVPTDKLVFTKANELDVNIKSVIDDTVQVSSSKDTNWGGTP